MNLQPNDRASASPSVDVCVSHCMPGPCWAPSVFGERRTLLRHLSVALQIALVTHDDDGEVVLVLYPENLLLEGHDFLEALPARNAVH